MVKQRPPGMMDVARLAHVSHQTVSRVLNDSDKVAPATRARVEEAIAELGYRRNSVARALVTRRSGILGVIAPAEAAYGTSSMLLAIEVAARQAGYYTGVAPILVWNEESLYESVDHLLSLAVEALVAIAPYRVKLADDVIRKVNAPVVVVSSEVSSHTDGVFVAQIDQDEAVGQAMSHLFDLGHTKIAHIEGPQDWSEGRARKKVWEKCLADRQIPQQKVYGGAWDGETGYKSATRMLEGDVPTAIFAANDVLAIGAISAITDAGYSVPEDISVVGFDDIPGVSYALPALTTVRQNFERLGDAVIGVVQRAIKGEQIDPVAVVGADLVVRSSTAPPRTRSLSGNSDYACSPRRRG